MRLQNIQEWWSCGELNPGPLECHSSALPTELQPRGNVIYVTDRTPPVKSPSLKFLEEPEVMEKIPEGGDLLFRVKGVYSRTERV